MKLHVETHGAGPALLLLHGWAFDSRIFSPIREALARRWTVHSLDLPGYGRSSGERFGSLDALCDEVAKAMPPAALVCGWSLGGLVAQRFARRHAARLRALALVSSTPSFVKREDWADGVALAQLQAFNTAIERDPRAALDDFVRLNALDGRHARAVVRKARDAMGANGFPGGDVLTKGLQLLAATDLRDDAAGIRVPTAVIHGTADRVVPVQAGEWLARRIRGARWTPIPDAAHLPFLTHPADFVGALEALDA